jgi:hypothetical protein
LNLSSAARSSAEPTPLRLQAGRTASRYKWQRQPSPPADTFSVVSAGASAPNPDQLIVTVDSPSAFVGLTAQFVLDGTDPYNQTMTVQSSETDPNDANQTQTTWTATIPAGRSGLPLGSYTVDLQGAFTDSSTTYTAYNAAGFTFDATSSVTLAAANANLNYPNTAAGLSGTVTLTNPDGTPDTDYAPSTGLGVRIQSGGTIKTWHDYSGQTIWIDLHPKGSNSTWYYLVKVKTNSKGQFSVTFKDPISATWDAVFEGNDSNGVGHLFAGSPEVYVRLK